MGIRSKGIDKGIKSSQKQSVQKLFQQSPKIVLIWVGDQEKTKDKESNLHDNFSKQKTE